MLADFGRPRPAAARNGHVFNLGHGISQHTPPDTSPRWSTPSMSCRPRITAQRRDRNHERAPIVTQCG